MTALITIYIPTKNRRLHLSKAIDSVLNQTYKNWELIIVNDASTDDTESFLTELTDKHHNIKCFHNTVSQGACAARNTAIQNAKGLFVTGLDDDDLFTPNRLQVLVDNYDDKYSFISTSWVMSPNTIKDRLREFLRYKSGDIDLNSMLDLNHIGNQVYVRRDRILSLGGFDENLQSWQDYDMWIRLIERFGPSLKLKTPTQIILNDESMLRITTSPKRIDGIKYFIEKHRSKMTNKQVKRVLKQLSL
ncbi:glycosyltransferase [Shewanella sp. AS1]|uniref:glycosyltransferase n=1 Tax=Shewanella sp. AS1 TaxID=2907626 RepID=UPI001F3F0B61|nr:glycosyltransferase [Shewanella sp. AS1]MCE9680057.1 glycosyltransferase [Shewanella sp. AS1]